MKSPQRRSRSKSPLAVLRSELERVRAGLRDLSGARDQSLRPALVPIPIGGLQQPRPELPQDTPPVHLAFGRKKDKSDDDDEEADAGNGDGVLDPDADSRLDQLPPIPSAMAASEPAPPDQVEIDQDTAASWRPLDAAAEGSTAAEDEPADDLGPERELRPWGTASFSTPDAASRLDSDSDTDEPGPWGVVGNDDQPAAFNPAVVGPAEEQPENLSWLQSGAAEESAPWSLAEDTPSATGEPEAEEVSDSVGEIDEAEEIEPETPVEEAPESAEGLDAFSEVLTVQEEPWSAPVAVVEETVTFQTSSLPSTPTSSPDPSGLQTRSFPLPEGEVVFRNLRAGFTDPARLLRHLAGEGHTGVLHVLGVDGANSYVVLVDGYVVAVAVDRQGSITTTNRISFPNFPNSQDTINVISYSRQIARGLGLLLHAPVRFAGLGAMFVNLEGLRSYLSKYSSSGGLIVHAHDGIGVALFEDGKLLGAYANGNAPTSDLAQLRDLVKDLEAEIDVRFGGPQELEPTPLDTLLSGHPL